MRFQVQQFAALHQLALDALGRGKQISGIGWTPSHIQSDVKLHVDGITSIRFNGEGFDIYRASTLAEINVSREEALDVTMAAAVHATLVHKPSPVPGPPRAATRAKSDYGQRAKNGWITRRANMASAMPESLDGTKSGLIAAMVLRPEGATAAEIKRATGWPSICVQRLTERYGIALTKTVDAKTSYTRYFGTRETEPEIVDVE